MAARHMLRLEVGVETLRQPSGMRVVDANLEDIVAFEKALSCCPGSAR